MQVQKLQPSTTANYSGQKTNGHQNRGLEKFGGHGRLLWANKCTFNWKCCISLDFGKLLPNVKYICI